MKGLCLTELPLNKVGVIDKILIEGRLAVKLEELGFLVGSSLSVKLITPLNDPLIILLNDSFWALRRETCEKIFVTLETI